MRLHPQILRLPGVRPVRQRRSEELLARLLSAGEEMLRTRNFDELSIAELAERADATVGAFYSRLDSKDVFFKAMNLNAMLSLKEDLPHLIPIDKLAAASNEAIAERIVTAMVIKTCEHRGLIRATYQQSTTKMLSYNPTRQYRRTFIDYCRFIIPKLQQPKNFSLEQHFQFGFQLLGGLLINILLFDPGPWSLDDPELIEALADALLRYWDFA